MIETVKEAKETLLDVLDGNETESMVDEFILESAGQEADYMSDDLINWLKDPGNRYWVDEALSSYHGVKADLMQIIQQGQVLKAETLLREAWEEIKEERKGQETK